MKNLYNYSRMMRAGALLCLLLAGAWQGSAQTWTNVGTAGFSGGLVNYTDIAIDASGNQYVVYADAANSNKATVMTNSGSWTTVGSAGFSAGTVGYTSIAIDSMSMTPYVVYRDNANSGKATVMMYNGGAWVVVGSAGFSAGTVDYTSIAIDGTGTPYVIYRDAANSSKATVMSYNGSAWVVVGSAGFSAGSVDYTSIAIDGSGTPYVVYMDAGNSFYATVMSYNGSAWVTVGSAGFSAGIALHTSIDIDGTGTPYVVYSDDANSSKATVMSYNGSAWVVVGSAGFSAGLVTYTDIAIDGSGTPYVVYRDNANSSKATVMKYNGSAWVGVGSAGFSAGQAFYASIAIHGNGDPYVVYQDQGTLNRATVMYFPPNAAPTFVNGSPQGFSVCQNAAATAINSLLAVSDADAGQTLTWTVTTPPTNGSLSGVASYTATSTGGTVTPTGMTYTPTASFTGTDVFVIEVSDGVATATTTVNVTVKGAPTITTVSPMLGFPASSVTITGTGFDATATNNIVYFGATRATVTGGTTTSLTVTVPTGATFERVNVNNSVTCGLMAASQYPYLPYYDNSAYVASTINVDLSISLTSAGIAYHTAIGDIDGDGKADIVTANITTGNVSVFRNTNSSGSLLSGSFSRTDYGVGTGPFSVALGDVDGDGKLDVVASNQTSGNATVLRNTSTSGSVSFAGGVNFSLGSAPQFCTIADINDDGKPEIISANNVSNDISVLKNQCTPGSVSFAAMVTFTTSARPAGLGTGDIDGDGKTDVVVACYNSNIISVLRNTSSGGGISFAAKVDFTGNTNPYTIGIGDVDGDGKVDIAVSNNNASGTISLFRNTSTVGSITLAGIVNFTSGSLPGELDMGDIDGDGKVDIAVANVTSGTVSVFRNTASSGSITSASLAAKVDFPAIASSRTMAVGDLDGDGKADLVCGSSTSTINVFRNNPLQAITGTATVCVGSTTTLSNATAGGTWSSSNPAVGSISSLGVVTGVSGGTITITYAGTAASGPVLGNYTTYAVTVNALPTVSAGSNVTICEGNNTILTASGATTYTWAPNTNLSATTGTSVTASPSVTVIYTVTGTDANTCVNTATVQVSVNVLPAAISGGGGSGIITTIAGNGTSGFSGDGSAATTANIAAPGSVAVDASGNIYIADQNNNRIRKVNTAGVISTVAGNGTTGFSGDGGPATAAGLWVPIGVAVDATGNIYIADQIHHRIRKVNTSGIITTVAGNGSAPTSDGVAATTTGVLTPSSVAVDGSGNIYIADLGHHTIRMVNTSGIISTVAGINGINGFSGDGGAATAANLDRPIGVFVDASGSIYIADQNNKRIRKVDPSGIISTIAGNGTAGYLGDGVAATATQIAEPNNVAVDAGGNVYITDHDNQRVRKINTSGIISTIGGNGISGYTGDGVAATTTRLDGPIGIAVDASGSVYIADQNNNRLRKINGNGGTLEICTGASVTLSNATSGGTWSSNNANVSLAGTATTTVTVTGVTAGTSVVSYTLPTGCYTTTTVTINQTPTAITGTLLVNVTQTTTLNSTPSGGAWSSSNMAVGTVNSTSGVVTGITAGTTNITYTMPSGCYATATVTVNNYNNGLDFDGSNDYAVIASRPSLGLSSGSMTIEFWAKPTIVDGNFHWVVAKDNTNSSVDYLIGLNSSNHWRFIIRNLAVDVTGATTVVAGTWYHVAGVYNGTTATLYVNGVSDGTAASAGSAVINGEQVLIGARNFGGPTQFFGGTVDEVRIWNVARSSGQITGNMNCDVAQDANLVAYYRFDQGTASGTNTGLTCAYDYSGNSNSGTLTNMALTGSASNYVLGHVPGCNTITLPSPGTFSGNAPVCVGSTITLSNTNPNGVWTSLATGIATVGSLTGIVTGVTSGTVTVNYTLNCSTSSVVVTVNPLPTITGNTTLSTTITTKLSATPSGGTWVSVSTGVATVNSTSGVVTGASVGTSVISYTTTAGCVSTTTVSVLSATPGLNYDGSNDVVDIGVNVTELATADFTLEAWVKTTGVSQGMVGCANSNTSWEPGEKSFYLDAAGRPTFVGWGNGYINSTTAVNDGNWHHVAVTWDYTGGTSGIGKMYVDGNDVSTGVGYTAINANLGGFWLGRANFGGTEAFNNFNGTMDEVRIWNVARTQGQIQGDMNCDVPQNANLLAYYRFNEGAPSGTNTGIVNAFDYSGNYYCGALTNFTKTGGSSNYVTGAVGNCNTITIITPAAITGNTPVCVGFTVALANANTGGVWTSGNTGTATVNSTSGVVTGVAGGTVNITYTLNCAIATTVVTVNALPVVTFTAQPGANACAATNVTYTTQAGMTSYVWGFPGTAGVDYNIISGGTGTSNTVVLQYYTPGPHTVTVNYTDANGCTAVSATSSTPTTIQMAPTITSVTPLVGAPTLAVSIVGTNFNTTTTNNIVYFGATRATVTSATATSLSVTVPVGATFSTLSVENDGCSLTGYSGKPFLQTYNNAPYIAGTVNLDPKVNFSGLTAAWGIALGDIDGDGKSDIVIGENGTSLIKVYRNTATVGVLNTSSFAAPVSFTANAATRGVTVRDVDNDGKLDVIVEGTSSVSVFRNNSTVGTIALDAKVDFASGSLPNYTAVEDLDGDGKADLAVANFSSGTVSVFRNTSTPGVINSSSFATNVDFVVNANPQGVAIGDMDGDGKKDIVVSNRGSNNISVIRNTSIPGTINGSSFAAKIDFTTATGPVGIVVADFDGDGKVDVATACYIGNVISVFRNTSTPGSITLPTRLDVPAGSVPFHQISVADMDGDSKPDLITGASGASSTIILRNISVSGTISFASLVSFPGDSNPYSVATGDLDGDNLPDVAVANQSDVVMTVYRNNPLQPIAGLSAVCESSNITLSDATPNGIWTSSNTAIATVGSTTGVVTGVSAGVVNITYQGTATSMMLGNYTIKTVTVNPRPVPTFTTSPATMLCVGNVVTYTTQSGQSNYIWSVPGTGGVDYSIASGGIGTSNNTVTLKWLTVGVKTVTVNYTDANGCTGASPATHTATVNPNPTTITGTASICVGQTTTFSSTPSGGTWTSSAPSIATVGSASGFINGISAGTAFITYTLSTGCYTVRAVFVNPLPTLAPTNSSPACAGGLVNFTSGGSGSGVAYAWSGPSGFTAGVSNPGRSSVALTHAGTYTVTATITATGCSSTATTVVTINPVPTTTPTNTSPVCIGGTVNFNAVATATGTITYSWTGPAGFTSAAATPSRSSVTSAHAGAYVIAVSTPGSGCNATAVTIVTVNATPAAAPTNSSPVCVGSMVTLSANPVSGTGVTGYSWSGPGGYTSTLANPTVTPTTTTTYSLTVTSGGASGCSPSTVYTTIVTVNPMPAAIVSGGTSTFNYTAGIQSFTVPAGVTSLTVDLRGAKGGTSYWVSQPGGNGGRVQCALAVTPGQILNISVGGAGANALPSSSAAGGYNGGGNGLSGYSLYSGAGGGGASDIRIGGVSLSDRIIVAAGGGGGGDDGSGAFGGNGGGIVGSTAPSPFCFGEGGGGASSFAGGTGGTYACNPVWILGNVGSLGNGGNAGTSGGGGGGGFYGGGGGCWGGGGGGSSFANATFASGTTHTAGFNASGNGSVIVSYNMLSFAICVGNTITLSTTPAGGTWTSGSTGVATVVPSTGVVTGVAGGTATITYTLPTGCYTTAVVTVNSLPAAIGGTAVMCAGASTTLTNTVSGGTWSSSNTGIATVGSTTGIVNGATAGNANITYTLPTGCFSVKTVTVNTTPGTITGTMSACVGATTTLSSAPSGGTWSSSNTGTATVSGSGVVTGVAAGTVSITYMLSTGCYTTASVTINPNPAAITGVMSFCAGSTTTLASTTTGGTWSSSMPSVATVGASSGIVTGAIPGTAVITYQLPTGCSTTATVTVNTMPTAIASVAPICVGGTTTLSSTPGGGTWSSSSTALATVSGSGVVSGLLAGNPVITYAIGSCYVTSIVTINPNPAVITGTMVLCTGSSTSLTTATSGGTWTSSATGVATIGSTSGLLTGVSGGTATITYMMGTGCYTTATVTINTTPSAITGTTIYCAGTTGTLTATPSGGTWSSSNTAMATVSGSGVVNAISAGTPVITYSFGTSCMSILVLTVNPNPAAITGTTTVCAGSITTLASTSAGGTWSSSMPSVATVGASSGIVTGSIAGTTTITYTLPTGCYTTTNVTVNALPVIATWPGTICVSSTATLTATPAGGTWTSSNTGIATIGAGSGIATGVSAGTAMLTYTSGVGCSSATAVTVNGLPTIATWSGALCVSSTTTLNATPAGGTWSSSMPSVATIGASSGVLSGSIAGTTTITYTLPTGCIATSVATINPLPTAITGIMPICVGGNTTLASTPSGGMWSSSNTGVATVGSTSGIAVGVSAGTAVMTYTVSTGCIMTAVLTVNPLPAAITGITNVCTGFTTALFSASTGGTWSSSNITLATIGSATGVVTGHVAGTLTITYTLPTGCLTTTSFTVNPTPAPVSGTLDVCVGLTTTLSTTPTGGTWTSSNPAEATIGGSTGLVTGMSAGMPVMTYTLPTGCRVMAVVTVNPLPAAISGASTVCTGAVTTLSSATTGGTWSSSSTGTASVGASTGIITGVTAGTVTITYMLPTGCIATKAMTVNATPTAITGTLTVCTGYTTALASSPTGGTWSSSNPAAGSVSSTGVVTGITAGMPVITYTLPTGCYITAAITINPTPPASTGSNQVCIGSTSTLANTLAGGTWSSSNPTIASVTASTGIVSGLVAGTLNITYTMPTGCFIVTPMTVNALPSSISGPGTVCPGATITLSSTPTGGTWTSSNTMIATVGSTSGIVTGVAGGNVTISYTLATGCRMTAVITVNPAPNLSSFSLPTATSPCVGNSSLVTLNSASIGSGTYTVTYDLAGANASTGNTATVVISSSTGSFTIPSSLLTLTGAQTAIITSITNSFGCSTTLTTGNVASFAVNVLPTVFTVSGGGGYCAGGTGLHLYLSGSTVGVNYQLYNGASPVGGFVAGTSTGLDFGVFTTAGTYTVVATNATTGCVSNMTGSATITINPLPTAFLVTGGGSYCAGGTGVLVGLAGSQTGVNYQLYNGSSAVGSPVSGAGGTISFGLQTGGGTYTVVATDATTMCVSTMSGSVTVVVNPLPTAFTGPTAICQGSTTTLGSTPSGGAWTSGATSIATVASTSGFVTGVSGGVVTITYTLPTGCMMTGVLTVNPLPAAITGASSVCTGSSTLLASTTSGGTWTSSNTAFATVGSTSGSVTGVMAGTVNITYTLGTGCYVIKPMTINATPAAISGSSTVCTGATTILTSATTGGTWSSSASQASVVPTTGVVSGVSAGTATITYTLPSGCFVTLPMTVNATPAAIGGTMNVCAGATRTLTNTTSGGTWSSSNVTLATVGSTSGVVSGLAAGTVIISYTMPTGCFTTTSFTVNPAPAAITGLNNVCLGSTIALSNTTSGGTWSSSASGTASVTSTGIVSGAATGTATITYTIPGGCFTIYPVTVNPNPATITGTANVCVAASTTLSNATAGGTWTSGNPTIASVGGGTGIVTGLAAGTPTISYTLPTGCFAIRVVTVNPNPAAIAGPTNVCTGQAITLTNATTSGTWSSSNTALGTVNPTSGVVTGIAVGTPIISYTLGTGCFATYAVVVNQTPSAITGPSFVCVGSTVTLSNAYGGGTWSSSNTTLATVGASTGLVSGLATGMPVITYSLPPGCITTMVISVNPTPAMITGTMAVCVGSTTILSNATGGGIWSSGNPGVATITGSTGMVSGISAGTANITYTLPGGCTAVATVTVNPLPAPIAGTDNVCEGLSTTLTNTSGGGTWASSNTLVAIVGSASGVVTGLSAGTITITYTLPTSCFITMPFTVNPLPASITGTAVVCVNATTTLSDATTGGLWSSSSPAIATIGSASGVVTGITGGNTIVTYTLPTGCIATRIVTVNPLPTIYAVTGGGGFCTGGTGVVVGLSGSNSGINYQLYNGSTPTGSPVAGTGASISFGLITVAGTYTVKATNAVTGCFVNMSGTATVYGIPLPIQYTVTGGGSYCAGGSGFAVGLASSQPGVSYQLYNGATLMGAPLLGTGAPISFGTQTLAGTYTVVATNTSGCVSGMLGSVNIIVNPLPTVFTVTGGGAYCSGGSGAVVGLSGSATGINYQLYRGITLVTSVAGTGSSISFGAMTVAGTYNVVAVNASTGCTNNMSGSVSVSISSLPVSTYTVGGGGAFCFGSAGVNVTLSNSDAGVNYELLLGGSPVGSPMSGIGSSLNFGPQTTAGTYTIRATSTSTGCVATMTGSVGVTVNPLPVVQFITGGGSYCAGGTGPAIGISGSQSGVSYRLIRDGATLVTTVAGTGSAFSFGAQSVAGTYTIVAVNATTTCSVNMPGSTVISINPLPTAFTVTGGGGYCIGGSGVAVMLSGSQTGVSYQLNNGSGAVGAPVAGTGSAISFGLQTVGSTYTVVATNTSTGCVATMSGSVVVTINPLPTAYAVTGGGVYCTGGSGVAVGVANSQTNVNYQLFLGGSPVGSPVAGTTGSAISFGLQTTTGTYTVVATNAITGCVNNMTGSVTISVTSLPSMYLVTGGGSYCIGGTGVAIGLSGSQTGVSYRLYNGTTPVGSAISGTGGILSFGLQTAAGTYTVVATATSSCSSNMLGSVVVNINSLPTLFTVTGGGSYCTGGTGVSVGLSSSLAGTSYQLFRGTTPVGTPVSGTGLALNFGLMTVTGTYTVFATDLTTGCTQTMTGSVNVATNPLPTTYTVSGGGSYCSGGAGVAVGLGGSQSGVRYQLYRGSTAVGSPVAGTGSTISFGMQTTAGTYSVIATDTGTFCTRNMTGSVTVSVSALPNIYTMTGGGGLCTGGTGVAIGLTGSQAGVTYRLYLGGSTPIGSAISGTGAAISFGTHTLGGTYTVVATSTASACTSNMSGSAIITVNPLPTIFAVTGGGGYCSGGSGVGIGLANSTVGVNYQLYRGTTAVGAPVAGTGSPLNFGLFTTTGTYTVSAVTAATGCSRNMSGSAVVSVSSLPTAFSVTGGGSYCSGGAGVVVALSGSNTGISYQLFRGTTAVGSPVAGTGAAINFGLQTVAGTYTVMAVNTTTSCGRNMTGSATVLVNAAPAAFTMTGGGSYCTGSTGLAIGLSGSASGITYRLYRGTTLVATLSGTGSTLSFGTFTTAGTYTVIATGSTTCTTTMTGLAVITVNALPTAFTVTGGGSYCSGGSGLSIGLSGSSSGVSYQLMRGPTAVGSPMAGTGSALSFGLQTIAGTYTVVAVNATTGCTSAMTGSATISIIAAPTVYTVTGGGAYCSGPGHNIYLSGSQTGVSYQLYLGFAAVGSPVSGTGSAINFGTFTTVGTYTVRATTGSSSCTMMMSGSASITSGSLPNLYSVTGGGSLCAGGTGYAVGLSGSQTGVNYQLYRGTSSVGSAVAGTGGALSFGTMTTAGGYTVVATNPTTGCIRSMSGSATIVVNALPTTFSLTGGGAYCSGGTGVTIGLGGSTTGISYKLYRGTVLASTISGSGSAISFGLHTTAGTYTVVATNTSTGCTSNMTGSATVSVNTTPTISGSIYTVAPAGSITLSGSPTGGVWSSSATSVATVGSSSGVVSGVSLGTTTISYTMSTGCRATRTVSVTPTGHREAAPESATGIVATNNNNSNIYVVPNPNKGVFTVKGTLSVLDEVEVTIELTNMLGQVMYTGKVLVKNGELSEVVRLSSSVANGMYLLNVNSPADSRVIHIVVEQ